MWHSRAQWLDGCLACTCLFLRVTCFLSRRWDAPLSHPTFRAAVYPSDLDISSMQAQTSLAQHTCVSAPLSRAMATWPITMSLNNWTGAWRILQSLEHSDEVIASDSSQTKKCYWHGHRGKVLLMLLVAALSGGYDGNFTLHLSPFSFPAPQGLEHQPDTTSSCWGGTWAKSVDFA